MAAVILPVLVVCALSGIERAKATKAEFDKLQGEWVLESISGWDGDKVVTRPGGKKRMTITKDRWEPTPHGPYGWFRVRLDPTKTPKHMDRRDHEPPADVPRTSTPIYGFDVLSVYRLEGDTLTICQSHADAPRPKGFDPAKGEFLLVWKRVKK